MRRRQLYLHHSTSYHFYLLIKPTITYFEFNRSTWNRREPRCLTGLGHRTAAFCYRRMKFYANCHTNWTCVFVCVFVCDCLCVNKVYFMWWDGTVLFWLMFLLIACLHHSYAKLSYFFIFSALLVVSAWTMCTSEPRPASCWRKLGCLEQVWRMF